MSVELMGCYKISEYNLNRLVQRHLTDITGSSCPGASRNEIATFIYLTQIADSTGYVQDFRTADLEDTIGCSRRDTFLLLKNLQNKGFLTLDGDRWSGYNNIQILNNDFSNVKKYNHKTRYLNTNREFFIHTNKSHYQAFRDLSLYAMRLLLLIMFRYDKTYGYHISHDSMASDLGIRNRCLIHRYLKELEGLLNQSLEDPFFTETCIEKKRIRYGHFHILSSLSALLPNSGIEEGQESYYKRYWMLNFQQYGVPLKLLYYNIQKLCHWIYEIVSTYLSKGLERDLIENTIRNQILSEGIINERTIIHADEKLKSLLPHTIS